MRKQKGEPMELKIPIEVDFDDLKSLLDDLGKLQTYKLFEGDEMVLVDIKDVAKVLMDHVKAKKSVKGDMISRADAVDAISKIKRTDNWQAAVSMALMDLPSAQSEIITCMDCIHYTPLGKDKAWGRCSVHSSPTENQRMCQSCDFCAWAERRTDERFDLQT